MRRAIRVTAVAIGLAAALAAVGMSLASANCGSWLPLGCRGADPELTRLIH
jgi:hypothetical protein